MAQKLIQTQRQEQKLQQRLSQQQMLQVKLLEMPLAEFEESIAMEIDDNPALEMVATDDALYDEERPRDEQESFEEQTEREEREDALEKALENIGRDDEMPETFHPTNTQNADYEEIVYGDTTSFYDKLKEQIGEQELTDTEREVMEYLIGSLDDDGLLRKSLDSISDELAVFHNIYVDEKEISLILNKLQTFDPPGIGARNLQECLLLQVERKPAGWLKTQLKRVFRDHFDAFTKKHWRKIQVALDLSDEQVLELQDEIRKLNPKPGASLGETMGRSLQQITPDFIVDTADDGTVTFALNRGSVPELTVSPSFTEMVEAYKNNRDGMSRQTKEALLYAKEKVDKAQGFIEAVKQRRHTLYVTMKAIIDWQRRFFQEGDEADLRPMILKDIADKTGLDISTISRVSNQKYAQTRWGTFPLRHFFSDGYVTDSGEEFSTRKMKVALKEIIDNEDKKKPLSDEALTALMAQKGFPIARRTVAKYREQMGLAVARLRKV
ncbi:MAG: RNA polymerase factor sigma-54 [Prevotella sp.]|nr:RNA polymerase factor sigma-54 [Prevotella sp.]